MALWGNNGQAGIAMLLIANGANNDWVATLSGS